MIFVDSIEIKKYYFLVSEACTNAIVPCMHHPAGVCKIIALDEEVAESLWKECSFYTISKCQHVWFVL